MIKYKVEIPNGQNELKMPILEPNLYLSDSEWLKYDKESFKSEDLDLEIQVQKLEKLTESVINSKTRYLTNFKNKI